MSENNFDFKIIEKNSFSGGRVYSENKDGFILDEGFQIFLDNYPESKKLFDYMKLGKLIICSDLKVIKDNLMKKQEKYTNEIHIINTRLKNKNFVERAPKHIVDQEKTNYNNLKNDIKKISLTVKSL